MALRISLVGGLIVLIGAVVLWAPWEEEDHGCDFDQEKWSQLADDARQQEAEALVDCGTLLGLTREEVADFLGDTEVSQKPGQARWVVGRAFIDPVYLIVVFNQKGRVGAATVKTLG